MNIYNYIITYNKGVYIKSFGGLLLIIADLIVGLYLGVWWAFIGGIIQVIEQVRADILVPSIVALGIAKILFAGCIGMFSAIIFIIPGMILLK